MNGRLQHYDNYNDYNENDDDNNGHDDDDDDDDNVEQTQFSDCCELIFFLYYGQNIHKIFMNNEFLFCRLFLCMHNKHAFKKLAANKHSSLLLFHPILFSLFSQI